MKTYIVKAQTWRADSKDGSRLWYVGDKKKAMKYFDDVAKNDAKIKILRVVRDRKLVLKQYDEREVNKMTIMKEGPGVR